MATNRKGRWIDYLVFGLSVFLAFCLLFEPHIALPNLLIWLGHWHPLLLHFPIVLLLLAIFMGVLGKKVPYSLLSAAVILALLTAIAGFFLGKEVPIKGPLLIWHQWLGGGVALLAAIWYGLYVLKTGPKQLNIAIQLLLVGFIGFAGHFGAMVTHGEDYLALPGKEKRGKIPENPFIYGDVLHRTLEDHCLSCHNENKQKGELVMTSMEGLLKGGESGKTLIPGDPGNSEIIRRLLLPPEDEDHMPPEGKRPLEKSEIQMLERWITLGASDTLRLHQLAIGEPLAALVRDLMEPDRLEKWTSLPKLADSTLQNLSTDYLTVRRVASNTDALSINVYLPPVYDPKPLLELGRIAPNIVELDLSGLPLGPGEIELVGRCTNLERLELDRTPVTDEDLLKLNTLVKLELLKIYDTGIGDSSVPILKELKNLKYLYIHNAKISDAALDRLKMENPQLSVNSGMGKDLPLYVAPGDTLHRGL